MKPKTQEAAPAASGLHPIPPPQDPDADDPAANMQVDCRESAGAMLERLVDRMFLRALQFVLGGVVFGVVFFPVRGRGSGVDVAIAATLLALATSALIRRRALLGRLRARPTATLLFPVPALIAVTLDGGFDSVWTPLVAITIGVPATLGLPWLSLGCAIFTATGQAAAAWLNRADTSSARLAEATIFSAVGTVAAGVGIALSVATLADFLLHRRPQILEKLRESELLLDALPVGHDPELSQRLLSPAPRTALSGAELQVVTLLAAGRVPKQIAADLAIAVSTVRSHLKTAKRKTHARTLTELVGIFVIEDGQL